MFVLSMYSISFYRSCKKVYISKVVFAWPTKKIEKKAVSSRNISERLMVTLINPFDAFFWNIFDMHFQLIMRKQHEEVQHCFVEGKCSDDVRMKNGEKNETSVWCGDTNEDWLVPETIQQWRMLEMFTGLWFVVI